MQRERACRASVVSESALVVATNPERSERGEAAINSFRFGLVSVAKRVAIRVAIRAESAIKARRDMRSVRDVRASVTVKVFVAVTLFCVASIFHRGLRLSSASAFVPKPLRISIAEAE
jgi:hypothetical protein